MALFLFGFSFGSTGMLLIAMWLSARDHKAWCDLFDRQQAIIEKLRKERGNP